MKVRVESAPSQGEHKASPLLCDGFAFRGVHGGKGTFLSLHPEISRYVSFANNEPCAGGAPPRMKLILPYPYFQGKVLQGYDLKTQGETFTDTETVANNLLQIMQRVPGYQRLFQIKLDANGQPENPEDLERIAQDRVIVCIREVAELAA